MSSEEDRLKHSVRRRNKVRRDMMGNDLKGAFKIKVLDARKPEYRRERINLNDVDEYEIHDE